MKLWLIRHAKSAWSDPGLSDFDRPLNKRGRRDGPKMQTWLSTRDHPASWIWSSRAVRAKATAEFVAAGFAAASPTIVEDRRLYLASPETLLEVLQETPIPESSVALVAHNPGLTYLVNLLSGEEVLENLPTFGIARFDVDAPWSSLRLGGARLEWITSPKRLADDEA
jgi:phosphohistidine phosphatase